VRLARPFAAEGHRPSGQRAVDPSETGPAQCRPWNRASPMPRHVRSRSIRTYRAPAGGYCASPSPPQLWRSAHARSSSGPVSRPVRWLARSRTATRAARPTMPGTVTPGATRPSRAESASPRASMKCPSSPGRGRSGCASSRSCPPTRRFEAPTAGRWGGPAYPPHPEWSTWTSGATRNAPTRYSGSVPSTCAGPGTTIAWPSRWPVEARSRGLTGGAACARCPWAAGCGW